MRPEHRYTAPSGLDSTRSGGTAGGTPVTLDQARPLRGFTLTELLVVITIIVILLAVAVPSFTSMVYSYETTLARSQLRAAVRGGADAAILTGTDSDAALVFFYEPGEGGGRTVIVPYVQVGTLDDLDNAGNAVTRDVFAPTDQVEPVQLPKYWMVRAYAPAYTIDTDEGWYENTPERYPQPRRQGNWVFPETGFYDEEARTDVDAGVGGAIRQTFMVRFEAGSGRLLMSKTGTALAVAPRPSSEGRNNPPFSTPRYRLDQSDDLARTTREILGSPLDPAEKRALLGDESGDTVLVRSVAQLALYDETRLVSALAGSRVGGAVRISRTTGSVYDTPNPGPRYVQPNTTVAQGIKRWIEGDANLFGGREETDEPQAVLYTIDRHTAELHEVETQYEDDAD